MLELTSAEDDETATRDNNSRGRPPSGHPPGHYQAVKPGSPGKRRAQGGASPPSSPRLSGPASPRAAAAAHAARGAESPTEDLSPGKPTGFMSPSYAQRALLLAAMSSTMAFFANGLEHAVATWLPPYGVRHCARRDMPEIYPATVATRIPAQCTPGRASPRDLGVYLRRSRRGDHGDHDVQLLDDDGRRPARVGARREAAKMAPRCTRDYEGPRDGSQFFFSGLIPSCWPVLFANTTLCLGSALLFMSRSHTLLWIGAS